MTAVDQSAVARVLGIETVFKDLRGGSVVFLPQRIAVFAQGRSDAVYSTTKRRGTSAGAIAADAGWGCPAEMIFSQLFPKNGDGIGTLEATWYPLEDAPGSAAAVGSITPSGTATAAGARRVRAAGIESEPFVLPVGVLDVTTACRKIHEACTAALRFPMTPTYTYATVTAAAKSGGNTGNGTCTVLSVDGSPVAGVYSLRCNAAVANGGVFTLLDPNGVEIADDITMTPGVGGATVINAGDIQFTLTDGTTNFSVGDGFDITVPATDVQFTTNWKGESGNDIVLEVTGATLGLTFAIVQPTGGLVNPSVEAALEQVGNVWESMGINALNVSDTTALDVYQEFGEGRWNPLVRKPMVIFSGDTNVEVEDATAVSSGRRTDRVNSLLTCPGSVNLPCVVAARQVARIARMAANNPPTGYGKLKATGLLPGTDQQEWNHTKRDQAVKAGCSTVEFIDGVVNLCDVVTMYRPTGEDPPAYRNVVHIVRLQNITFNNDLELSKPEWAAAPLIPDDQATVNPLAKKPKSVKAVLSAIADNLGLEAIISDPEATKASMTASINGSNPDRCDTEVTYYLSGNTGIIAVTQNFGFFFGGNAT